MDVLHHSGHPRFRTHVYTILGGFERGDLCAEGETRAGRIRAREDDWCLTHVIEYDLTLVRLENLRRSDGLELRNLHGLDGIERELLYRETSEGSLCYPQSVRNDAPHSAFYV